MRCVAGVDLLEVARAVRWRPRRRPVVADAVRQAMQSTSRFTGSPRVARLLLEQVRALVRPGRPRICPCTACTTPLSFLISMASRRAQARPQQREGSSASTWPRARRSAARQRRAASEASRRSTLGRDRSDRRLRRTQSTNQIQRYATMPRREQTRAAARQLAQLGGSPRADPSAMPESLSVPIADALVPAGTRAPCSPGGEPLSDDICAKIVAMRSAISACRASGSSPTGSGGPYTQ